VCDNLYLGVEIGGTKLQLGVGAGDGILRACARLAVRPEKGAQGIRAQIEQSLDPLLAQAGVARAQISAVGIGFGGPVDSGQGVVITSHQIAGWDDFPMADWVRRHLGIALVALENDADTAGLGEARFGAGVGRSPVLYVTIGSGIGGGLIIDGRIYRGSGAGAVEIGYIWIEPGFGPHRLLEHEASGWAIAAQGRARVEEQQQARSESGYLRRLAADDPDRVTAALVAEAARLGDRHACAILDRAAAALAQALAHAVTLLAPRRVILGGGVSLIGEDLWFSPIRRQLDSLVFPPFHERFDLVPAALGEQVVVHGALALASEAAGNLSRNSLTSTRSPQGVDQPLPSNR
jgi:glucokinase